MNEIETMTDEEYSYFLAFGEITTESHQMHMHRIMLDRALEKLL